MINIENQKEIPKSDGIVIDVSYYSLDYTVCDISYVRIVFCDASVGVW